MTVLTTCILSQRLARGFGRDIDAALAIKNFDLKKVNINQPGLQDSLKLDVAPSIGNTTKDDVRLWPDELKIIASVVTRLVEGIPAQNRSWDSLVAAMMQNSVLEPEGNDVYRMDNLSIKDDGLLKRDSDKSVQRIAREVQTWFAKLVGDEDVLRATLINYNDLAAIFCAMQQGPKGLSRFVPDGSQREKTLLDISVVRYPDIAHPYIKFYHIKLTFWSFVNRVAGIALNKSGVTGVYHCRTFKPRQEIISRLSPRVRMLATQEAEDLFL